MSYILDALKKAEQERDLGRVPRLESVHDDAPRRARALPWLIAGILLVNVAALVWWLRPGGHSDVVPVRQAPLPVALPPRIAQTVPVAPAAPPIARAPVPAVVARPAAVTSVSPVKPRARVTMPDALTAPAPVAVKPAVTSAPLLRDLPADVRAAVPPLSLDVHVYAPTAAGRFVLINMKKYHEGDQLAEGPRIEEITEEGVILSYQGQMFRIARP